MPPGMQPTIILLLQQAPGNVVESTTFVGREMPTAHPIHTLEN